MNLNIIAWCDQSGTKPNLVAKILATKIGNLSAYRLPKFGRQN